MCTILENKISIQTGVLILGGCIMYSITRMDDYVDNLYQNIGVTSTDDLKMDIISERLGIGLHFFQHGCQTAVYRGMKFIFIDERLPKEIQWQRYTHELCHVLWHYGNQSNMVNTKFHTLMAYQEVKAEYFSLTACMPAFLIRQLDLSKDPNLLQAEVQERFCVTPYYAEKRLMKLRDKLIYNKDLRKLS